MLKETLIYKYTNYERLTEILINNALHFSCPLDFNDPFDSYVNVKDLDDYSNDDINKIIGYPGDETKKKQLYKILNPDNKEAKKKFADNQQKASENLLVLSLSELKDNILMWSHYADYHKGFCIGFKSNIDIKNFIEKEHNINIEEHGNSNDEIKKLLMFNNQECLLFEEEFFNSANIEKDIQSVSEIASDMYKKKIIFLPLHKVEYPENNDMPEAYDFFKQDISSDIEIKRIELEKIANFLKRKNNCWQYEKEKRLIINKDLIHIDKCEKNNIKFEKSLLREIIFGIKTSDVDKLCISTLVEKAGYKNVKFYQARRNKNKYELEIYNEPII